MNWTKFAKAPIELMLEVAPYYACEKLMIQLVLANGKDVLKALLDVGNRPQLPHKNKAFRIAMERGDLEMMKLLYSYGIYCELDPEHELKYDTIKRDERGTKPYLDCITWCVDNLPLDPLSQAGSDTLSQAGSDPLSQAGSAPKNSIILIAIEYHSLSLLEACIAKGFKLHDNYPGYISRLLNEHGFKCSTDFIKLLLTVEISETIPNTEWIHALAQTIDPDIYQLIVDSSVITDYALYFRKCSYMNGGDKRYYPKNCYIAQAGWYAPQVLYIVNGREPYHKELAAMFLENAPRDCKPTSHDVLLPWLKEMIEQHSQPMVKAAK